MMEIAAERVKELRLKTGVGIMECKSALREAQGDIERAVAILRERGIAKAAKRAGRTAAEGMIVAYVHPGSRIGVLLELNCETDFVARNEQFQALAKDLAMHVAAMNPLYVRREEVPEPVLEEERRILRVQTEGSGKPPEVLERIIQGRLEKFFVEACLVDQPYVRDPGRTVEQVIKEAISTIGENLVVRRFCRYQLGEASEV
ncbi:MAG: translation elongation factor Ts, partial [Candidatus Methylomirabilales bacterium]